MTWLSEFPCAGEPDRAVAADAWKPDDLMRLRAIAAATAAGGSDDGDVLSGAAMSAAAERARGFDEGRLAGERAERARLRAAFEAVHDALCSATSSVRAWEAAFEDNVTALAIAVARHLVDDELRADPEMLTRLVRRARQELAIGEPVRVRVNPADLAALMAATERGTDPGEHWVADPAIAPGGCVVEGRERIVDGRVETALERLYRRLAAYDD